MREIALSDFTEIQSVASESNCEDANSLLNVFSIVHTSMVDNFLFEGYFLKSLGRKL